MEGGSVESAVELAGALTAGGHDAVVGVGGGRTLDVAKYAASLVGLPMVSVATSLAHDGMPRPSRLSSTKAARSPTESPSRSRW